MNGLKTHASAELAERENRYASARCRARILGICFAERGWGKGYRQSAPVPRQSVAVVGLGGERRG